MAPLWDALDVEHELHRHLTGEEAAALHDGWGAKCEAELVIALNRPVFARQVTETKLFRPWYEGTCIYLGATPVQSVQSVTIGNGPSLTPGAYMVLPHGVQLYGPMWSSVSLDDFGPAMITIVYTAGLDAGVMGADVVNALAGVLASRIARDCRYGSIGAGPEHSTINVEGAQISFNQKGSRWDPAEQSIINSYRRRLIR